MGAAPVHRGEAAEDVPGPGRLVDARVAVNPSQRVSTVTFVNHRGDEIVVSGSDVRTRLNLRSTWFRFGVLSLARPTKPVDYGTTARLTGQARGGGTVTLEQRAGAVWEPAARLKPAPDGTVTAVIRPLVTTDYRLTSATFSSTPVSVTVAPRVRLHQVTQQTALTGIVRPIIVGARWRSSGSAARPGVWSRALCSTTAASSKRACSSSPARTARA